MKNQFTPEQIKEIAEAGGADYVEGIGNWGNGQGDYIMVNEKTSGSSIMIYLSDLEKKGSELVRKECLRKYKEFKNHGKRRVFKIARHVLAHIGLACGTLWRSLGMGVKTLVSSQGRRD
jgi:hypothetical protein